MCRNKENKMWLYIGDQRGDATSLCYSQEREVYFDEYRNEFLKGELTLKGSFVSSNKLSGINVETLPLDVNLTFCSCDGYCKMLTFKKSQITFVKIVDFNDGTSEYTCNFTAKEVV